MSTNVNNLTLESVINQISNAAPVLILICGLGTFGIVGFFQFNYYSTIFHADFGENSKFIGFTIASFTELIRFVLLISSVRDFSDKKKFNGWLGFIASAGLVYHDINTNSHISSVLSGDHSILFTSILNFLVILGIILEIRLILTISSTNLQGLGKSKEELKEELKGAAAMN